jgi:hypothetical protein
MFHPSLAMIEWKENEHDFDDITSLQDPQLRVALRNFVLLKYFKLQNMRKRLLLFEYLIGLWDDAEKSF